jgi:hypothetical protein
MPLLCMFELVSIYSEDIDNESERSRLSHCATEYVLKILLIRFLLVKIERYPRISNLSDPVFYKVDPTAFILIPFPIIKYP